MEPSDTSYSPVPDTLLTRSCINCKTPTTYTYLCEHCSEEFLIELWNGGRERGLRP